MNTPVIPPARPRARDIGLVVGTLPTGHHNAITDVPGVRVGHATLISGEGTLVPGQGPVRTGVTVIVPHLGNVFRQPVHAAVHTINGFGKPLGFEQVRELGTIESPIALTNTLNVGRVADALVEYAIRYNPDIGIGAGTINVVVAECNDGYLNDIQGRHVHAEHVLAALQNASSGLVAEGNVGAGTGTTCFGWKGGIGSASRVLPAAAGGFTVGALVQANFGRGADLVMASVPVGKRLRPPGDAPRPESGSVVTVLATDAPLVARQLRRLCVRVAAGLARVGGIYGHGSGDFAIAFSTAEPATAELGAIMRTMTVLAEGNAIDWLFRAVVECVEEAVINSLLRAETMAGRDGHIRHAIAIESLRQMIRGA